MLVWTDHTADQKTVTVETLSLKGALARTPELRRKNKRREDFYTHFKESGP